MCTSSWCYIGVPGGMDIDAFAQPNTFDVLGDEKMVSLADKLSQNGKFLGEVLRWVACFAYAHASFRVDSEKERAGMIAGGALFYHY